MVNGAGKVVCVVRKAEEGWVDAGAADDHCKPDTVDLVLMMAFVEIVVLRTTRSRLLTVFSSTSSRGDFESEARRFFSSVKTPGFLTDRAVIDENRIGMRTPDIYTQDHDHTSST